MDSCDVTLDYAHSLHLVIGPTCLVQFSSVHFVRLKRDFNACSQRTNWTELQQVDPVTRRVHWSRASASRLDWLQRVQTISGTRGWWRRDGGSFTRPATTRTTPLRRTPYSCARRDLRRPCRSLQLHRRPRQLSEVVWRCR